MYLENIHLYIQNSTDSKHRHDVTTATCKCKGGLISESEF